MSIELPGGSRTPVGLVESGHFVAALEAPLCPKPVRSGASVPWRPADEGLKRWLEWVMKLDRARRKTSGR